MKKLSPLHAAALAAICTLLPMSATQAQGPTGVLDLSARISPTAARPEPVRQFTFYVLTKSYTEITKDVESQDAIPTREKFIDDLKISPELKEWLRAHDVLDLTATNMDRLVSPDDILHVPEFLLAYQRANSGGVTHGIPRPKFTDADKSQNPERYKKLYDEYMTALRKFIHMHPESAQGIELELTAVNPQPKWAQIQADHKNRVLRLAPALAQTKYLAAQVDTDLDGRGTLPNLPAGNYWVSTLNLDAGAGDTRVRWDVPVSIQGGHTSRLDLTNLNAIDAHGSNP